MTTINIHKDKLLPAAFAYQLVWRKAHEQEIVQINQEYMDIQKACRVAEDGIVSLDIESALCLSLADANDVVQRIFGEEG